MKSLQDPLRMEKESANSHRNFYSTVVISYMHGDMLPLLKMAISVIVNFEIQLKILPACL